MSDSTITPTNRPANSHAPPAAAKAGRRTPRRPRRKKRGRTYTPEERRQAVEAYYHSQLPLAEFARVWGVSYSSLHAWIKRYEEGGPRALERGIHAGKGKRRIGRDVEQAIVATRKRFPSAGLLLASAASSLNSNRLRGSKGYRTANTLANTLPSWYNRVTRDRFYREAGEAIRRAEENNGKRRARHAANEAVLMLLERHGIVERTRGVLPNHGT